jgi:hypothetical protein
MKNELNGEANEPIHEIQLILRQALSCCLVRNTEQWQQRIQENVYANLRLVYSVAGVAN